MAITSYFMGINVGIIAIKMAKFFLMAITSHITLIDGWLMGINMLIMAINITNGHYIVFHGHECGINCH